MKKIPYSVLVVLNSIPVYIILLLGLQVSKFDVNDKSNQIRAKYYAALF